MPLISGEDYATELPGCPGYIVTSVDNGERRGLWHLGAEAATLVGVYPGNTTDDELVRIATERAAMQVQSQESDGEYDDYMGLTVQRW